MSVRNTTCFKAEQILLDAGWTEARRHGCWEHPAYPQTKFYLGARGSIREGKNKAESIPYAGTPETKLERLRAKLAVLSKRAERLAQDQLASKLDAATKPDSTDLEADQRRIDMNEVHKLLRGQRPVFLVSYWDERQREYLDTEHPTLAEARERYNAVPSNLRPSLWVRLVPATPH